MYSESAYMTAKVVAGIEGRKYVRRQNSQDFLQR